MPANDFDHFSPRPSPSIFQGVLVIDQPTHSLLLWHWPLPPPSSRGSVRRSITTPSRHTYDKPSFLCAATIYLCDSPSEQRFPRWSPSSTHMLVMDTDSLGGLPQRLVCLGRAMPPVSLPQARRYRLERLLRQPIHDAVHHSLKQKTIRARKDGNIFLTVFDNLDERTDKRGGNRDRNRSSETCFARRPLESGK